MSSAITAQGLAVNRSSGSEKNCIVYSLFCIVIVIISFVVLLNCLYLTTVPHVSHCGICC